jgi:hypothetical protein
MFAGSLEEHVMSRSCAAWARGRKQWSVTHKGDEGTRHLKVTGKVPQDFAALKRAAFEAQSLEGGDDAEIDHVFELPLHYFRVRAGLDVENNFDVAGAGFEQLYIGTVRRLWRARFGWRLVLGFFVALFGGLYLLGWLMRKIGWQ